MVTGILSALPPSNVFIKRSFEFKAIFVICCPLSEIQHQSRKAGNAKEGQGESYLHIIVSID
jgi:hypothetical protein